MIAKGLLTVSALAAAAASATYAGTVYKETRRTDSRRMTRQNTVPDSLRNSKSVNEIVDPKGCSTSFDTRSISIDIPPHRRNVSDEELLSRFTKAFFGGAVIRPERFVLQNLTPNLVNFSGRILEPHAFG
ncbi:hypothetical protein N7509_002936 [Penicillium cosmopolitanum]|uniref:Uncharacterized protein n=1 Tax=Penicillium cosmopolitanum TaxID=1131564 RepID=A0A9W9W9Z6_9EURO|nr:uncharacterized protein N7509_002936 [Penicillium cosmopolitanum]KAJ5409053.1 hypothetical protein N7509_002936 [Penicillium cosmopolitanum]